MIRMSDLYRIVVPSIAVGTLLALSNLYGTPWLSMLALVLHP